MILHCPPGRVGHRTAKGPHAMPGQAQKYKAQLSEMALPHVKWRYDGGVMSHDYSHYVTVRRSTGEVQTRKADGCDSAVKNIIVSSAHCTLSVKLSYFTVWCHTWHKNWVNCAVLTGNSAGLRTVLSSRLSHKKLRSSLRESHSFLSLPADTTMTSSQGTSVSSNSFSRWASHDIFLFKYHFLLHILRFLFFFSDNIMADVASNH